MPAVTVIIPFHNRLEWVAQAVRTVLAQTFTDFELILVDDGSDTAPNFLEQFQDKRIICLRQANRGAAAARNLGISHARGRYIAFLDSDDLYFPEKLEKQVRFMEAHPDAVLSHTSYQRVDSNGCFIDTVPSGTFSGQLYPDIIWCCLIATPTVMVRSEGLGRYRFDEDLRVGEDVLLWIRLSRESEVLGMPEALTQVRIHGENTVLDPEKQLEFARLIIDRSLRDDRELSLFRRAKGSAGIYRHQAYLYYKAGGFPRCARYLLLSLLLYPPGIWQILAMAAGRAIGPGSRSIYD